MSSIVGFSAPKEYDRTHQQEIQNAVQRELDQSYRKDANVVIPFGKTLSFNGASGKLVTLGLNGSDAFTISIDGATAFALASDAALTSLTSTVNSNTAAISTEASTRSSADSALASRASSLEATVDTPTTGLTARVTTAESAIVTTDGKLSASYALTVDGNGRIASMKLLSDGTTSSVKFTASTFQVFNDTTDEAPFEVVGGAVKIKTANVGTLTASNISVSSLSSLSANLGTITAGTISLTSGSYVLYEGAGFGASSDLVFWYGLSSVAIGSATKTNGVFALATDGVVYLGAAATTAPLAVDFDTYFQDTVTYPSSAAASQTATVTGGVTPYSYTWQKLSATGDAFTTSSGSSDTYSGTLTSTGALKTGTENWTLRVTDNVGTSVYVPFLVGMGVLP